MESKTYLEKRKELEDKITLFNLKTRRIRGNHSALFVVEETNKLYKELAELDAIEMMKCKNDPHYFATTYMTVDGKPVTTMLNKEEFNKVIRPTEEDINKWFVIRRSRRNGR